MKLSSKIYDKKMNKKLTETLKIPENVASNYLDTKKTSERENLKEVCEGEEKGKGNLFCWLPLPDICLLFFFEVLSKQIVYFFMR